MHLVKVANPQETLDVDRLLRSGYVVDTPVGTAGPPDAEVPQIAEQAEPE
jgi:hypothetical protein